MKFDLPDEQSTTALAARLLDAMPDELAGWTLLLSGELGAGKSTLARALIRALGHPGPVPSPTYTLVEPYELPTVDVYHIDLYRVAEAEELRYLGWNDYDTGLRIVEWPERAAGIERTADLIVRLRYRGSGREAEVTALSQRAAAALERMTNSTGAKPAA